MNRCIPPFCPQDSSAVVSMLSVSDDGYIRLSFAKLQTVSLIHLISGLDEISPTTISDSAMATEIMGYTEWISKTFPTITIGWDWQINTGSNQIQLQKIGKPRSNILIQDSTGIDIGTIETTTLLEALIDALDWAIEVQSHIETRYTPPSDSPTCQS